MRRGAESGQTRSCGPAIAISCRPRLQFLGRQSLDLGLAMATRAQLVEALLEFPAPERAEAARELLESLDAHDDPLDVDAAWRVEIARRVEEIESNAVQLEDGPTAMAKLRSRARARLERRGS